MSNISDAALLARFRAGDQDALEEILARYEAGLFQFLLGMLRDHHLAEDALQDTFIRALTRLDDVDPEHLRGWLFTVAYHQAMLLKRRQKSRHASELPDSTRVPDDAHGPEELAAVHDDAARVQKLLAELPPAQQDVVRQRIYEGKRFREIAEEMNCPLNTALARMHEALKKLRLLWGNTHA